jgi:adenine-specific DNA-methyltransferase
VYSDQWKDGKPERGNSTKNHIIKYQILEDFEDTIRNIEFQPPKLNPFNEIDYKIKYMLNFESKDNPILLNTTDLAYPFNYSLSINNNGKIQNMPVDLIETFNYLVGIEVISNVQMFDRDRRYSVIRGMLHEKNVIIIWTTKDETFDPVRDLEFTESEILSQGVFDEIYVNGNSLIKNAISLDKIFKQRMNSYNFN